MSDTDAEHCRIRRAGTGDVERLFEWVRRPDSLRSSIITRTAPNRQDHRRWFADRLSDPGTRIWIVECGREPVGQVRFQDKGMGPEISIYVEAAARRRGFASRALQLALAEARSVWPGAVAIARVRTNNERSRRFFEMQGFHLDAEATDHWIYARALGS